MLHRTAAALALAAGMLAVAPGANAAPPTEEQITAANEAMNQKYGELRKAGAVDKESLRKAANASLGDLTVAEMTLDQIDELQRVLAVSDQAGAALARLKELAHNADVDGAKAAVETMAFVDSDAPAAEQAAVIHLALTHPAVPALLQTDDGGDVFLQLTGASPEALKLSAKDLEAFAGAIPADMPASVARRTMYFYDALMALGPEQQALRDAVRTKLLAVVQCAMDREPEMREKLTATADYLDGPYAKGQLLSSAAPVLTIEWSSDPSIKSLSDLKGKVVMLDFWATWCGPCLRAFPTIRDLRAHYEGYPVAIVGVTSLQGAHYGPDGKVDTKGDPEKEYSLMKEFMGQKDMTWTVVFTAQEVFNPAFGVTGIPHLAIIDPAGKVRYNALRPGKMEEETEKIDALLKEFNLPTPSAKP